jgi:hypothetical protein
MKQISQIVLACLFIGAGCQSVAPEPPVWEQVKFKDLAPSRNPQQTDTPLQFNVYFFSVPAGNFPAVKDIWTTLAAKQIRFNNAGLFSQNGFVAGFGQQTAWPAVAEKLRNADTKSQKTIELIIPANNTDSVSLLRLDAEKNIFYKAQYDQVSGVTVGPGQSFFRFTASTIPDMRGVCRLTVEPIFQSTVRQYPTSGNTSELVFKAVSFSAQMSPGDFLLLGPSDYADQDMTLRGIFFSSPGQSAAQIYLIVCAGVNN